MPRLIALNEIGLIISGVFVTDAGAGFPPGAPGGAPTKITWHGMLHEVKFLLATVSWLVLVVVLIRRFRAAGDRRWFAISVSALVAVIGLSA